MAHYLKFTLSMPNRNTWNGKWSGDGNEYYVIKSFRKKSLMVEKILENSSYSYNFGDGWRASISVEKIDSLLANKLKRKKHGFCGYEWMVESIIKNGEISCP